MTGERLYRPPISVQILIEGQPTPIYEKDGRYYIAGEALKEYAILVRNTLTVSEGGRLLVLESVDGRDVLMDQAASWSNHGMVVRDIWKNEGWRLDDDHVRRFVFGDPDAAVAVQATGSAANVGVIGIAVWKERRHWPEMRPPWVGVDPLPYKTTWSNTSSQVGNAPLVQSMHSVYAANSAPDLGTAMGDELERHVGRTDFERASEYPAVQVELHYRTMQFLVAHGIASALDGQRQPNAWPGNADTGYARYVK